MNYDKQFLDTKAFLSTLFKFNEQTCYSPDPFDTSIYDGPHPKDIFFSINPMHTSRADKNVTAFRNILLECDKMPLDQQIAYIQQKIPVTSIVYSGGKSYHFIISLADECSTKEEYDVLVRRLHALLPQVDPTTKNPSRFSRLPGVVRPDTGKLQELVYLGSRIPRATLEAKLPPVEPPKQHSKPSEGFFSTIVADAMLVPDVTMQRVGVQGRNQFFFWLGQRLQESGTSPEQKAAIIQQTYNNLRNKNDFTWQEAAQAARVKS